MGSFKLLVLSMAILFVAKPTFSSNNKPIFSIGQPLQEVFSERWELLFEDRPIGHVQSIGGKPRIVKIDQKLNPNMPPLFVIRYDAGAAGTKVISQLDRVSVVSQNRARTRTSVLLDFPVQITRYEGPKIQLQITRDVLWGQDNKTLSLGSLDEFPKSRYVWKKNTFLKVE